MHTNVVHMMPKHMCHAKPELLSCMLQRTKSRHKQRVKVVVLLEASEVCIKVWRLGLSKLAAIHAAETHFMQGCT